MKSEQLQKSGKMFMISNEAMHNVMSLREKMADSENSAECIADLEHMIKIKESHLARAEWASCCANICNLAAQIDSELQMLQNILELLRNKDSTKASALLEDYIALLQESYKPEPEHW
jgi:hypothetical protein